MRIVVYKDQLKLLEVKESEILQVSPKSSNVNSGQKEMKSEKVLKNLVSKVKQTDKVMKTPESKLVKVSSHPQTPEEECQKR